jgi:hypothetical protein
VDAISPSPHDPGTATVAIQRRLLKDFAPYIYRTTDYGETWTRITDGIPSDYPVRTVREDPNRAGLLYAGTDFGLFFSLDAEHWHPLQRDLPVTPITDIRVQRTDLALSTMGRSFWVLDNLTPLYQMDAQVAEADYHLFAPKDTYRMRYWGGQRGPSGPEYPEPGATIDFALSQVPETLTLDILSQEGEVVRRFVGRSSDAAEGTASAPQRRMGAPPVQPSSIDTFAVHAGHNRFTWDLRHAGPEGGDGPRATPGTYQVRLAVGEWSATRSFEVKMDPRLQATGTTQAALEEQHFFNRRLQATIDEAEATAQAIDSVRTEVRDAHDAGEMPEGEAQPLLDRLDEMHGTLVTAEEGSYQPPMLIDQLGYLAWMTGSADQELGEYAFSRFETLRARLNKIQQQWRSLRTDLNVPTTD